MESQNQTLQQQLEQFFQTNSIDIDSDFIQRFIHNIIFEEIQVSSEWLYAWYKSAGYKSRYDDFCKYISKLPISEISEIQPSQKFRMDNNGRYIDEQGKFIKKKYQITQIGINIIMMQFDQSVRLYYSKCEQILKQFFKQYVSVINQQLQQQTQQLQDVTILLDKCKRKCFIYRIDIYDEKGEYVQYQYIGSSENFNRRKQQHLKSSSNPLVKDYIDSGRKCKIVKLHEFEYHYKEQRASVEQQYINQLDQKKKLNLTSAQAKPEQQQTDITILEETKDNIIQENQQNEQSNNIQTVVEEEEKELQSDQQEQTTQKPQLLQNAFQQIDQLKAYLQRHNGQYPSKRSQDKVEHELAIVVARVRKELKGQLKTSITDARLDYIKQTIPDFKQDGVCQKFQQSVQKLKTFYNTFKRIPVYGGSEQNEKTIYGTMQRIKQAYNENDQDYLTPDRLIYVQEELPFLILESKTLDEFKNKILILKQFNDQHQRLPLKRIDDEKQIHSLYYSIKDQLNNTNDKLYKQKLETVQQIYPQLLQ